MSRLAIILVVFVPCLGLAMMTGGFSKVKNISSVEKYAKFATNKISASSNSLHHLKLVNITEAMQQVVSGMNYKLQLVIGETECQKNSPENNVDLESCPLLECKGPQVCNATVWVQSWIPDGTKLTDFKCKQQESPCKDDKMVSQD